MRLAMVAGEASGDLLAALMIQGLKKRWPELSSAGIGGPRMVEQGFEAWAPSDRLSVFGYVDALKRLPELLWLRHQIRGRILRERPAAFVGVDAPDFNFGLETRLRSSGIRTVHFVCPSIWAWRSHRVHKLKLAADHVLCLFPFEPALLAAHGIAATYVGHPLADAIAPDVDRPAARQALVTCGLNPEAGHRGGLVALLPGSRQAEIRHIAPLLVESAQNMLLQRPGLHIVLPVAAGLQRLVEPIVRPMLEAGHLTVVAGHSHEVLAAADVAVVASGTATLEAALLKCPMVIVYRLADADWARMRRQRLQPWVGLPNILSQAFIVPERLQDEATPTGVAADALRWLDDVAGVERYRSRCQDLHTQLRQNTGQRAADALQEIIHG
ncbi:MAG: lipid-A-disaccharide synthase [Burkholderiaceae bacterium]